MHKPDGISAASAAGPVPRLPPWLRVTYSGGGARARLRRLLRQLDLNTVCENAACPNLCDCWQRRAATFLILGDRCSRRCRFCGVSAAAPLPPDPAEPERVAEAVARLGLRHVVVTSVTRDDLPDGGAAHFADTVRAVRQRLPGTGVEVLVPDFLGREPDIATVLASGPTVFGHNLETCERLTPMIRSGADYRRSLQVLAAADRLARGKVRIKSGFMLGLGEDHAEVRQLLRDLRRHAVTSLTIGQYLPPSRQHWPVARYVTPAEFAEWGRVARQEFGFTRVASAPLVRSSYMAEADSPPVPGKAGTGRLSEHVSASPASP